MHHHRWPSFFLHCDMGGMPPHVRDHRPDGTVRDEPRVSRPERLNIPGSGTFVTLDTWVLGWRPRDLNAANFPQLRGAALQNYFVVVFVGNDRREPVGSIATPDEAEALIGSMLAYAGDNTIDSDAKTITHKIDIS